ncbi:MAG: tetratricopeptide repeat protein [Gammaproteobacteria bacterium]
MQRVVLTNGRLFALFLSLGTLHGCASVATQGEPAGEPLGDDTRIGDYVDGGSDATADLMFELLAGEIAGQLGNVDEAAEHYLEAAKRSSDPQVAERAARIAQFGGNTKQALKAARRWVELDPDNAQAHQTLALLHVSDGALEKSLAPFDRIIEIADENGRNGFLIIGPELDREQDKEKAYRVMQMLVERHPDNAYAHFAAANLAFRAKEYDAALEAADRALAIKSDLLDAKVVRARVLMALERKEQAIAELESAVAAAPDNTELRTAYARMLVQAEDFEKAREVFGELVEERPDDADLVFTLGVLNMQQKYYKDASANFFELARMSQRESEAHYYLGRIAEEQEQHRKAKDWYEKVGDGDYELDAQLRIADMHYELGSLERARDHLKELRDETSDNQRLVSVYLAEGQLLRKAEQFEAGMDLYNRALTEQPSNEDLLYARALMAERLDRLDLLEADLRSILEEDPDNATALNALGYTLADRTDRIDEAREYIERALEMRPDDPAVIDSMGWVLYRMGEYERAEEFLRKAFSLLQDAEIAGHLGELMWARGNTSEAVDIVESALEEHPDDRDLKELLERFTR